MAISPYVEALRARVGSTRLLLPSATGIVYDAAGRILLVCQRDGAIWSTPGGLIEPDETPADAVVREMREETGLSVQPQRILGVFGGPAFVVRYPNGDEAQYVMVIFECKVVGGELRHDTDETTEARFVAPDAFDRLPASAWTREVLPLLYARPDRALFSPARATEPTSSS
jgi:8-oxo-dGTP pyrophosphatase MutT (NUDIX family)